MKKLLFCLLLLLASTTIEASDPTRFEVSAYYGGKTRVLMDDVGGEYGGPVFGAVFSVCIGRDLWIEGAFEQGSATWVERDDGANNWESIHTSTLKETVGMVLLQKRWTESRYTFFAGAGLAYGD